MQIINKETKQDNQIKNIFLVTTILPRKVV